MGHDAYAFGGEGLVSLADLIRATGNDPADYEFHYWIPNRPIKYVNQGDDTFYAISGRYEGMLSPYLLKHFAYMREKRIAPMSLADVGRMVENHRGKPCTCANTIQTDTSFTLKADYITPREP
ncbi:MAG: hypothetical protein ACYS30_19650 [Planctomycetota bacterium]